MATEGNETGARRRQIRKGIVCSTGGDKTIRVIANMLVKHPMYHKYIRRRTKLAAHDPTNAANVGDVVEITPCRPISKTKSWRLLRVLRRSDSAAAIPAERAAKKG